jgi:hypothetical protein
MTASLLLSGTEGYTDSSGKKKRTSRRADSGESEPCTEFVWMSTP